VTISTDGRIERDINMDIKEAIENRLSIRRYADSSIGNDHLHTLLKALQLAPSANNGQNWEFVFVDDPDLKRKLVGACFNQSFITSCTYFIAGIADPALKWHMVDITIAMSQLSLQAVELGYGTCWIGAFDPNQVKSILQVERSKKVVICMTLGVPSGRHIPRQRKPLDSFVYRNRYGKRFPGI
jgi:nitroreductase